MCASGLHNSNNLPKLLRYAENYQITQIHIVQMQMESTVLSWLTQTLEPHLLFLKKFKV